MSRPDGDGLRGTYLDPSVPVERFQQTAAPAAEADELDLRAALQPFVWSTGDVDAVMQALAGPLHRLAEQAAEAARLRVVVARVESLYAEGGHYRTMRLRHALDGTDG